MYRGAVILAAWSAFSIGVTGAGLGAAPPAPRISPPLADLTIATLAQFSPYTVSSAPSCPTGSTVLTLKVVVRNIGAADSPPVTDPMAISVQDQVLTDWTAGTTLPAIQHGAPGTPVQISVPPYQNGVKMLGHHRFKVTVNGKPWFNESSFANNTLYISVDVPNGFCGYSTLPTPAPLNPVNPPTGLTLVQTLGDCQRVFGIISGLVCPSLLLQLSAQPGQVALAWNQWVPCYGYQCVQQIDGFNLYKTISSSRSRISQANSQARFTIEAGGSGTCFLITAFKGSQESDPSNSACVPQNYSTAPTEQIVPASLSFQTWTLVPGAPGCTASTLDLGAFRTGHMVAIGTARTEDFPWDDCDTHSETNGYFARAALYFNYGQFSSGTLVSADLIVNSGSPLNYNTPVPRPRPCFARVEVGEAVQPTTTWTNPSAPLDYRSVYTAPPGVTLSTVDVTDIVKSWIKTKANVGYGFVIKQADDSGSVQSMSPGAFCLDGVSATLDVKYY